eukprot:144142-Heterocapsa_arctica.AAC.1
MLWDPQAPQHRNDHVEQVLGTYRKASKDRERTCGHNVSLYACAECKRAKGIASPEPTGPYCEPD